MRYSIITPTLLRSTLRRLCDSIDAQTAENWEHIIMVDKPLVFDSAAKAVFDEIPKHPRRKIFRCGKAHKDYGNTCRRAAWAHATGDYVHYLDDDNYYLTDRALEILEVVDTPWAAFSLFRDGGPQPPYPGDTNNILAQRAISLWPDSSAYAADQLHIQSLTEVHPNPQIVWGPALVMYPQANKGREF